MCVRFYYMIKTLSHETGQVCVRARESLLGTVTCVNEVIDMREREADEVAVLGRGWEFRHLSNRVSE